MAFLTNEVTSLFDGPPSTSIHPRTLAAGQRVFRGALGMFIAGKVYRAGPVPTALCLNVPGADANGGVVLYSQQANVRYSQITGGANKVFGVTVSYLASSVEVIVQLATDAGGVSTSTAATVIGGIAAHPVAGGFLRATVTGTGLGLAIAAVAAFVPVVSLCGVSTNTYDNSAGVADLSVAMLFQRGVMAVAPLSTDSPTIAMVGSDVAIVDDNTVKATVGRMDLTVKLSDILSDGTVFVVLK